MLGQTTVMQSLEIFVAALQIDLFKRENCFLFKTLDILINLIDAFLKRYFMIPAYHHRRRRLYSMPSEGTGFVGSGAGTCATGTGESLVSIKFSAITFEETDFLLLNVRHHCVYTALLPYY